MSKHTPGPWIVAYSHSGYPYQIVAPNEDDKAPGKVGTGITRWASISLPSSAEGLANARLIAAAPDLLEALTMVRDYIVTMKGMGHQYQIAVDAAIAKARGEA